MIYIILLAVSLFILSGLKVVKQYERGVIFRLGKIQTTKNPGLRFVLPILEQMKKVGMRIVTLPVNSQKIITRDNVSIDVAAVAYYQVVDPIKATVDIENVISATYQIAQTTVRNVVGKSTLDEVLSNTQKINEAIKVILDTATEKWGIYVETVELKDIQLPESMQRAMAKEAEAEREKRAKIIAAEGEALSAAKLAEASDVMMAHPVALQLRNLQTLAEIAVEKNSTIIFPSQIFDSVDSVKQFIGKMGR
jgi:regulator of protease activity HflC (stomatin/prohibitin superfamily)